MKQELKYKDNGLPLNGFAIQLGSDRDKAADAIKELFNTYYSDAKNATSLKYNGCSSGFCYYINTDNYTSFQYANETNNKINKIFTYREFKELFLNEKNEPKSKAHCFPIY